MKPVLLSCKENSLTNEEISFFRHADPFGFILFKRNCESPTQLKALTQALRDAVQRSDVPIFIDQEGGRVARLRPPFWRILPPARAIGALYEKDQDRGCEAMRLHVALTAGMLGRVGINGNCAPVLDLFIEGASDSIGDRALSRDPQVVATLGALAVETALACGLYPVVKHSPGHGRAKVDPHVELPIVEDDWSVLQEDFVPFAALREAPIAMNAHVLYRALDPEAPASLSARITSEVIRGTLGFSGLLFSDDLAMGALKGPLPTRARMALAAGADVVLYCSGSLEGSQAVCEALPVMNDVGLSRWHRAQERIGGRPVCIPTFGEEEAMASALAALLS